MLDLFSVSVVMIRVLAILIIVNATSAIPMVVAYIRQVSSRVEFADSPDIGTLVALVSYVGFGAVLLLFSSKFGRLVTRGLENTSVQVDQTSYPILQAVVFSALGAYVLVYSVPTLIGITAFSVLPVLRQTEGDLVKTTVPVEVQELIKTVLGVWLLVGGKRISASIRAVWKKSLAPDTSE